MIIKQRDVLNVILLNQNEGKIVSMNLVGSVKGKNAIIIDDIVDTAVIYSS